MTGFESYQPAKWTVDGLLVRAPVRIRRSAERRKSPFTTSLSSALFSAGLSAAAVAFPSIGDARTTWMMVNAATSSWRSESASTVAVDALRPSFANLFQAIRDKASLIPSRELRDLAERAASRQSDSPTDIDAWARTIASDIEHADD